MDHSSVSESDSAAVMSMDIPSMPLSEVDFEAVPPTVREGDGVGLVGAIGDQHAFVPASSYSAPFPNEPQLEQLEPGGVDDDGTLTAVAVDIGKDPTTVVSAGGVGLVVGFAAAGPIGAMVAGGGWAYLSSKPGKGGEIARATGRTLRATAAAAGKAVSLTISKIRDVNEKHGITRTIGEKLSAVDEKLKIKQTTTVVSQTVVETDSRYGISKRVSNATVGAFDWISNRLERFAGVENTHWAPSSPRANRADSPDFNSSSGLPVYSNEGTV